MRESGRGERESAGAGKPGSGAPGGGTGATTVAGSPSATNQKEEGTDQSDPQASPAVRHFRRGMLMQYGLVIYNAHLDKATNKPQLTTQVRMFRDGKPVFTGSDSPLNMSYQTDLKRLVDAGLLQVGTNVTPGE